MDQGVQVHRGLDQEQALELERYDENLVQALVVEIAAFKQIRRDLLEV